MMKIFLLHLYKLFLVSRLGRLEPRFKFWRSVLEEKGENCDIRGQLTMASHSLGFSLRALQIILVTTLSLYSFLVLLVCRSNSK